MPTTDATAAGITAQGILCFPPARNNHYADVHGEGCRSKAWPLARSSEDLRREFAAQASASRIPVAQSAIFGCAPVMRGFAKKNLAS